MVRLAFIAVLVARAALLRPREGTVAAAPPIALGDDAAIVERLAAAIRIPTVSHQDPAQDDPAVFAAFREHLERSYPALHATLRRELVGERSLLYTWEGRDPSKPAIVLMAITGAGMLTVITGVSTILQTIVEDEKRGRVMSFYTMSFMGTVPVGSLAAGALADVIGAPLTLLLSGSCCMVAGLALWTQLPLLRRHIRAHYLRLGIIKD